MFFPERISIMTLYLRGFLILIVLMVSCCPLMYAQSNDDPLVRVLVTKGVLTVEEARLITVNASPAEQRDRLATLLRDKGVISSAEFEAVRTVAPVANAGFPTMNADYKTTVSESPKAQPKPAPPPVIAAV